MEIFIIDYINLKKGIILAELLEEILDKAIPWNKIHGWYGEKLTERELKFANLFGKKGRILKNIYIPKDDGTTTEVDLLFITQKGIFVLESKNYSGWIFGSEKDSYWMMSLPNGQKERFYNPIKQNQSHIRWLKTIIGDEIPCYSIIVFSERCELKKVTVENQDIKVIKRDDLFSVIKHKWNETEDCIDETELNNLYDKLSSYCNADKDTKQKHVENINNSDNISQDELKQASVNDYKIKKCPKCGASLVLRTAKKGDNAGNQFYGCSAFPKCRYIENL